MSAVTLPVLVVHRVSRGRLNGPTANRRRGEVSRQCWTVVRQRGRDPARKAGFAMRRKGFFEPEGNNPGGREMNLRRLEMNPLPLEIHLQARRNILPRRESPLPSRGIHLQPLEEALVPWETHLRSLEIHLQPSKKHLQPRRNVPPAQEIHPSLRGEAGFLRKMPLFGQKLSTHENAPLGRHQSLHRQTVHLG